MSKSFLAIIRFLETTLLKLCKLKPNASSTSKLRRISSPVNNPIIMLPSAGMTLPLGLSKRRFASSKLGNTCSPNISLENISDTKISAFSFRSLFSSVPTSSAVDFLAMTLILLKPLSAIICCAVCAISGTVSQVVTCFAPNLAAIMASKPEPVPISNTLDSGVTTAFSASK